MNTLNSKFFLQHSPANVQMVTGEDIEALEDQWVSIKHKMNTKDLNDLQSSLVEYVPITSNKSQMRRLQSEGKPIVEAKQQPLQITFLKYSILDWSFTDDVSGEKIPVNMDTIGMLDARIGDSLYEIINSNNPLL